MRLQLHSGADGNIYREFASRTYGVGATDQQITAAAGTVGSMIPIAGPFIAAAASIAITIENMFKGCGATCTQATAIANQVEGQLSQNVTAYLANPIRTKSMQTAALNVFDGTWQQLLQACGNPQLQAAGQRCITDRQRGACVIKADGHCWNWFMGYRDPIANDPDVIPDAAVGVNTNSTTNTNPSNSQLPYSQGSGVGVPTGNSTGNIPGTPTSPMSGLFPLFLIGGGMLLVMAASR